MKTQVYDFITGKVDSFDPNLNVSSLIGEAKFIEEQRQDLLKQATSKAQGIGRLALIFVLHEMIEQSTLVKSKQDSVTDIVNDFISHVSTSDKGEMSKVGFMARKVFDELEKSIQVTDVLSQVIVFVKNQPSPQVFYKRIKDAEKASKSDDGVKSSRRAVKPLTGASNAEKEAIKKAPSNELKTSAGVAMRELISRGVDISSLQGKKNDIDSVKQRILEDIATLRSSDDPDAKLAMAEIITALTPSEVRQAKVA